MVLFVLICIKSTTILKESSSRNCLLKTNGLYLIIFRSVQGALKTCCVLPVEILGIFAFPTQFYLGFCQKIEKKKKFTYLVSLFRLLFQAKLANLSLSLTFVPTFSKPPRHLDFADCFFKLISSLFHFLWHFSLKKTAFLFFTSEGGRWRNFSLTFLEST